MKIISKVFIGILIIISLASFAFLVGINLGLFGFENKQELVDYNNNLIDDRNGIVSEIEQLTNQINTAEKPEAITTQADKLDAAIAKYETALTSTKLPKGAEDLKKANEEYASRAKQISTISKDYASKLDDENADMTAVITEYNGAQKSLNEQNIVIAETLNDIAGEDVVPQSEIDRLKSQIK